MERIYKCETRKLLFKLKLNRLNVVRVAQHTSTYIISAKSKSAVSQMLITASVVTGCTINMCNTCLYYG